MTYDEFLNFLDSFEEIKSFAGKINAANQNLQRIGSGSGRAVYDIDGTKVLKVAKNQKGVAQNEVEASIGHYAENEHILTKVFESANDDTWLVAEKAKKVGEKRIKELTGIPSLSDLNMYLKNHDAESHGQRRIFGIDDEIKEQLDENEFIQELLYFAANYSQHTGDWSRPSSYGEVLRDGQPTIVLTDYGLNDEVYGTYYDWQRKQQQRPYRIYEFIGNDGGNDDFLSDIGGTDEVRMGWAMLPYGVDDNVMNEVDVPPVREYSLEDAQHAKELAQMLTQKTGLPKPIYISGGSFGYAFRLGNEMVLKLTTNLLEAESSLKVLKHGPPKHLVIIYDVYKIVDTETNNSLFAIIQEYIPDRPTSLFSKYNNIIDKISPFGLDSFELIKKIRRGNDYNEIIQLAKGILTENPESGVSEIDRTWAYEYIVGILDIKKELIQFNIRSDDYTNLTNLGYKNGVLKFFDIGGMRKTVEPEMAANDIIYLPEGEEITEVYEKSVADRIAQQISQKLGYNQPQYIASGNFGAAYDIGGGKVLKITKDKTEAIENLKLIDKPLKYIAQPYEVFKVNSKSGDETIPETYVIILEKLDTDKNIIDNFKRLEYVFGSILKVRIYSAIESYLDTYTEPPINKEKIDNYLKKNPRDAEFFYSLMRINEELKEYDVESRDFMSPENLGYKKSGALGFFDVGFGNALQNPVGTKEITVDEDGSSKFSTDTAMGQDEFPSYNQNDTSPLTDNNVPPIDEDLEYNHVVGDATEDEYMMTERKLSYMPNAKAVTVKKKCRLGGLGNTSVACNQGDINNLEFKNINEVKEDIADETFKDLFKGKRGVAVGKVSKNNIRRIEKNGFGIFLLHRTSNGTNEWMGIVFKNEKKNVAEKLLMLAKQRGGSLKPNSAEEAKLIFGMLDFSQPAIEKYIQKHFNSVNEDIKKKFNKTYYRAVENNAGKTVKFKPQGFYEAIDDEGNPVIKYDTHWISDKPEVAASHSVGGAVLGLYSMFRQHGKSPNIFYIYGINEEPDVDISHWDMGDFALLQEVRYRRPVRGKYVGKVTITDELKEKLNAYYEMISGDEYDTPIYDPEYERQMKIAQNTDYDELVDNMKSMVHENIDLKKYDEQFPIIIDDEIEGLTIRNRIPNMSSIEASFNDYEILNGIRKVSFSTSFPEYTKNPKSYSHTEEERIINLAQEIVDNKEINPLIIAIDEQGPYVLEGGHRFDALRKLGIDSFPAIIVLDLDSMKDKTNLNEAQLMSLQELPFKDEVLQHGGNIYSVGGAVRDEFLGKESKDLDILITGIPMDELEQILSRYGRVDAVGKSFGILKFRPKGGEEIDIAIPRTEKPSGEGGHKGFDVTSDHALPIEKDLERRDFTINAIAKDVEGNIIDPFGGQEDLKNKTIRIVNPEAFSDDPLRMLRAVQFASRFGFKIEPRTMKMIQNNASRIKEIPAERILTEFDKIIKKGDMLTGAQLLKDTGLFTQIFGFDIKQSTIDRSPFDDVKTMGEFIFLLTRLLSNPAEFYKNNLKGDIDTYKEIKALDMAFNSAEATNLIEARAVASNMYLISPQSLQSNILPAVIKTAAQELLQGKYPKTVNDLAINGNDLMQLGLQGKAIGDMQKILLLKIYSNKLRNDKKELTIFVNEKR